MQASSSKVANALGWGAGQQQWVVCDSNTEAAWGNPTVDYVCELLTCRQPPAHACYCPGYVWAAPSSEASGMYPEADWQPSGHIDSVSSKWWTAPGLFYQTDTGPGGEWARANTGSCPACSLWAQIGSVGIPLVCYSENVLDGLLYPILTFSYSPKHEDARLFNHPVRMEEQLFQ